MKMLTQAWLDLELRIIIVNLVDSRRRNNSRHNYRSGSRAIFKMRQ